MIGPEAGEEAPEEARAEGEVDLVDLHRRACEYFGDQVRLATDDQWDGETPCTDWNLRQLVNHIVNEDKWAVPLMQGSTLEEVGDKFEGDLVGDDPGSAYEEASREALEVIGEPGALERTVNVSWGQISGAEYVGQLFLDHVIHGWDVAKSTGSDTSLDPELAEAAYDMAKPQEEALKASGYFGDKIEASEDDDLQTKLLAIFGRLP